MNPHAMPGAFARLLNLRTLFAVVMVLVFAGYHTRSFNQAAEELDIREAVFRDLFPKKEWGGPKHTGFFYLAIRVHGDFTDPDDALMARFAKNEPPVKRRSECHIWSDQGGVVLDNKTGEQGVIYNTGSITWISNTEVRIGGGYYVGNVGAAGNIRHLRKVNGKWLVIGIDSGWVS